MNIHIQAFSTSEYNQLLDINEAHELLSALRFDEFLQQAASLVSTHDFSGDVGCFLLHRHNELASDELMVRSVTETSGSGSAVVSETVKADQYRHAAPANLKLALNSDGSVRVVPLEFSTIDGAQQLYDRLVENTAFLGEMYNLLARYDLENIVGLALYDRALSPKADGSQILIEEYTTRNGHHSNVVRLVDIQDIVGEKSVPTNWQFLSSGSVMTLNCRQVCVPRSPGHSIEHHKCNYT